MTTFVLFRGKKTCLWRWYENSLEKGKRKMAQMLNDSKNPWWATMSFAPPKTWSCGCLKEKLLRKNIYSHINIKNQ